MSKIKVLYVEDEPFLGRIVKDSLESRQLEVMMVADGAEALGAYKLFQPHICVLDIMLPNKDGYTISKEIRLEKANIPIIFLTAKTQTEDLIKGFESGGNDYLRKPFSMEELLVRINNLLHLTSNVISSNKDFIKLGIFEFWPNRYELRNQSSTKKLSHREASLLQMLVENPNTQVIRKDILMKLWGDDSFFNSRNLDVYITKLREYLREDPSIEIITIKGIGYHFVMS